jgi:hypothetical protein
MVDMASVRPPQGTSSASSTGEGAGGAAVSGVVLEEGNEDTEAKQSADRKEQLLKKANSIGMQHPQIKQGSQIRKKRGLEKAASSSSDAGKIER